MPCHARFEWFMPDVSASLFDQLGGEMAIMAAADLLYAKLVNDSVTRPFFDGIDMAAQSRKLVGFMAWALGGPEQYRGRPLRDAHAKLVAEQGLSDVHFDAVAKHLENTLLELGYDPSLVEQVLGCIASLRSEVLGR